MNPCELNAVIASVANHLYCNLPPKDFAALAVMLSELSKSMFSMELLRSICKHDARRRAEQGDDHGAKDS